MEDDALAQGLSGNDVEHPQLRAHARVPRGRVLHRGDPDGRAQRRARALRPRRGRARARARQRAAADAGQQCRQPAAVQLPRHHRERVDVPRDGDHPGRHGRARLRRAGPACALRRGPRGGAGHPHRGGPPRRLDPRHRRRGSRPAGLRPAAVAQRGAGRRGGTRLHRAGAPRGGGGGARRRAARHPSSGDRADDRACARGRPAGRPRRVRGRPRRDRGAGRAGRGAGAGTLRPVGARRRVTLGLRRAKRRRPQAPRDDRAAGGDAVDPHSGAHGEPRHRPAARGARRAPLGPRAVAGPAQRHDGLDPALGTRASTRPSARG